MNISSDDPLPRRGKEPYGSGCFDFIEARRFCASGFGDAPQQVRDSFRESLVQLALNYFLNIPIFIVVSSGISEVATLPTTNPIS